MIGKRDREEIDTLITGDWHLGSALCKAETIDAMLTHFKYKRLILNGDLFDGPKMRLKRSHFNLLKRLSGLAKRGCEILWVEGNHDEDLITTFAPTIGARICKEYRWTFAGKQYIAIHGDQFDSFLKNYPMTSQIFTDIYWWFQYIFGSYADKACRFFKRHAKGYIRAREHVAYGAIEYARMYGDQYIFCGHIHHEDYLGDKGIHYFNYGCSTELPCGCFTIDAKHGIRHHAFYDSGSKVMTTTPLQN